jgi:hypothetical protein
MVVKGAGSAIAPMAILGISVCTVSRCGSSEHQSLRNDDQEKWQRLEFILVVMQLQAEWP